MRLQPLNHIDIAALLQPIKPGTPAHFKSHSNSRALVQKSHVSHTSGSQLFSIERPADKKATYSEADTVRQNSGCVGSMAEVVGKLQVSPNEALLPLNNDRDPVQQQGLAWRPERADSNAQDWRGPLCSAGTDDAFLGAAIQAAERFVRVELQGNDASHDVWHIERVRSMALRIASEEGISGNDLQVVHLAALLHDVGDWKYSGSAAAGPAKIQAWLCEQGVGAAVAGRVLRIIAGVGFKEELASGGPGAAAVPLETAVVQDADRLDAIGAIGIARCFTYGGAKRRVLHDPAVAPSVSLTQTEYMDRRREQTTINHFHEKLLKLRGMMKTGTGRRIAEQRHKFMVSYLEEFKMEWDAAL